MVTLSKQKVVPFLWFDNQAEEAARFYTSVFKNSKIIQVAPMVVTFELEGLRIMGLNGGPIFKFTEAFSLFVNCDTQEEIDYFWEALSKGGEKSRCGWLKDKYGLSWQVVPSLLGELMSDKDPAKTKRVMDAIMKMDKLEIEKLREAYNAG
jgi:predicted 3-demethylubiquinone-9 3-methyltransferase (glyoxalase superfamily)